MNVRSGFRRFTAISTGFCLGLGGLVMSWVAGYRLPLVSGETYIELAALDHAAYAGPQDDLVFIALIGSDYRPSVGGERGDALHVLAINTKLNAGTMLNIPRDTCAKIPGYGTSKINNAHNEGGPKLQGEVLAELIGVPIKYAVSVDFAGFIAIVDGVGGVDVDVPKEMDDSDAGAYFSVGPHHMDGNHALAYSRDRHDFGPGDITRSWNQAHLILSAFKGLRTEYASPAKRIKLVSLLQRHSQMSGATLADLVGLSQLAFDVDLAKVKSVTVGTTGGSCMEISSAGQGQLADFADNGVLDSHATGTVDNPTGL